MAERALPAVDWIARLRLQAHPEGGWFRRIYTDPATTRTADGSRAAVTSIHYLLDAEAPVGHWHRNRSTILHYLQHGGPVEYFLLDESGAVRREVPGFDATDHEFLDAPTPRHPCPPRYHELSALLRCGDT